MRSLSRLVPALGLGALTLGVARPAGAATLVVQATSDWYSSTDVATIATTCDRVPEHDPDPDALADSPRAVYRVSPGEDLSTLVRVMEAEVVGFVTGSADAREFTYHCLVELQAPDGTALASRPIRIVWPSGEGVLTVPVLLTGTPPLSSTQRISLSIDRDGDGTVSAGDRVKYAVDLVGEWGHAEYRSRLSDNETLVAGTVTANAGGVVVEGNTAGDTRVRIHSLALRQSPHLEFETDISPLLVNRGLIKVKKAGTFTKYLTQDADTQGATVVDLGLAAADWQDRVAALEEEVDALEVRNDEYLATIDDLTQDADGDGVLDSHDLCDGTAAGLDVDRDGCAAEQFCATVDVSDPQLGQVLCESSDWGNDEPLACSPGDCAYDWTARTCGAAE